MMAGKRSRLRVAGFPALGLLLLGCTATLKTSEIDESPGTGDYLPAGFPYRLPVAEVVPSSALVLIRCPDPDSQNPELRRAAFQLTATITAEQKSGRLLLVDYRSLSAFNKTGTLAITRHENGMLKTVNAGIEDQSAEIVAAIASTAAGIALLATAGPGGFAAGPAWTGLAKQQQPEVSGALVPGQAPRPAVLCKESTRSFLINAEQARANIGKLTTEIRNETDRMNLIRLRLVTQGLTEPLRKEAEQAISRLSDLQEQLARQKKALGTAVGSLSLPLALPDEGKIPIASYAAGQVVLRPVPAEIDAYMLRHFEEQTFDQADPESLASLKKRIAAIASVHVSAARETGPAREATEPGLGAGLVAKKTTEAGDKEGLAKASGSILYIEPARFRFRMMGNPNDPSRPTELENVVLSIPQAGHVLALPIRSGFGEKSAVSASFREDGSLLEARFERSASGGTAAAGLAQNMAKLAADTQVRRLELQKSAIDLRSKELAYRQAAAKDEASRSPAQKEQDALNIERARVEAELAIARTRDDLAKLTAPRPAS